ncbi:ATP-binding cassette domain-containing protein [Alicyclobacillus tolerans]|uniref:ABC transporter ATP-binding protein n=1 Tax=Alicyclobacillus tolerans TaxID=90970 RepID=UPI003B785ED0
MTIAQTKVSAPVGSSTSGAAKALVLNGLVKKFGPTISVNGVSLTVDRGAFFGLLGPNGAGKTTLISMISGLIPMDGGDCQVFGFDSVRNATKVKQLLGVVPQDLAIYPELNAYDNLMFFGAMYGLRGRALRQSVNDSLVRVGLQDRTKSMAVGKYSGGQKRRLNIAAALLHRPKLLILDEPTVGVDPQSRNHIFETLRELNSEGMTIIYTTHYMEEVETLCSKVAIIDHGQIIESGNLSDILQKHGQSVIRVKYPTEVLNQALSSIQHLLVPEVQVEVKDGSLELTADGLVQNMSVLNEVLRVTGQSPQNIDVFPPSLETVFIKLTGNRLRDE